MPNNAQDKRPHCSDDNDKDGSGAELQDLVELPPLSAGPPRSNQPGPWPGGRGKITWPGKRMRGAPQGIQDTQGKQVEAKQSRSFHFVRSIASYLRESTTTQALRDINSQNANQLNAQPNFGGVDMGLNGSACPALNINFGVGGLPATGPNMNGGMQSFAFFPDPIQMQFGQPGLDFQAGVCVGSNNTNNGRGMTQAFPAIGDMSGPAGMGINTNHYGTQYLVPGNRQSFVQFSDPGQFGPQAGVDMGPNDSAFPPLNINFGAGGLPATGPNMNCGGRSTGQQAQTATCGGTFRLRG